MFPSRSPWCRIRPAVLVRARASAQEVPHAAFRTGLENASQSNSVKGPRRVQAGASLGRTIPQIAEITTMTNQPNRTEAALEIQKPCPKTWSELAGDEQKRFCSECSLHVYNAAALSRREARELVASSSSRVCMRLQYDARGVPIFSDSTVGTSGDASAARAPQTQAARAVHWALSAAAGLLAACHGSLPSSTTPSTSSGGNEPPSKMGKVCSTELLGDVAMPTPTLRETLGEAVVRPQPTSQPEAATSTEPK